MTLPKVAVQICTFRRPREIRLTLDHLIENLSYFHHLKWVICDDHSGGSYLQDIYDEYHEKIDLVCLDTGFRAGWGINVNAGLHYIRDTLNIDFVYFTEDDYVLHHPTDLLPDVALLMAEPRLGLLRLDGIAGHDLTARLRETDISEQLRRFYSDWREGLGNPGIMNWWQLLLDSHHLNIYSNRPHLKRISAFHNFYGFYPEGHTLGQTEQMYAHIIRDKMRAFPDAAPWIGCPVNRVIRWYDDIGRSYQGSEEDIVTNKTPQRTILGGDKS